MGIKNDSSYIHYKVEDNLIVHEKFKCMKSKKIPTTLFSKVERHRKETLFLDGGLC